MSIFSLKKSTWWIRSKQDPRWNCDGRTDVFSVYNIPEEAEIKIKELQNKYGEMPDDLVFGGMKD